MNGESFGAKLKGETELDPGGAVLATPRLGIPPMDVRVLDFPKIEMPDETLVFLALGALLEDVVAVAVLLEGMAVVVVVVDAVVAAVELENCRNDCSRENLGVGCPRPVGPPGPCPKRTPVKAPPTAVPGNVFPSDNGGALKRFTCPLERRFIPGLAPPTVAGVLCILVTKPPAKLVGPKRPPATNTVLEVVDATEL